MPRLSKWLPVIAVAVALPIAAMADVVVSSNDGHSVMNAKKIIVAPNPAGPDTMTIIDVKTYPPKIKATFDAPGSVVGPPGAVWISKDESWGIVTSATRADAAAKSGGISPDDRVSVFDLTANPPKVTQTLTAGAGAAQVRVSPDGTMALVANRTEGTVSVFTVKDKQLTAAGKVDTGNPKSLPSAVVFVDDDNALLTRGGDNMVSVLHIDAGKVTIDPRPITTGLAPYTMDINAAHTLAAVSNMGRGQGDEDSVSLIDLKSKPYRTVGTFGVPSGPEPMKFSPDGRFLAIGAENGSTKTADTPFHSDHGLLGLYAVEGQTLRKITQATTGPWIEGIAFARDGKTVLVQGMQDRKIEIFRWNGKTLTRGKSLTIDGAGPESFGTAWP
ncbi:MAG TPA: beta-propeller fold lactonase family protein [Rhodopila sp.]|jgi:DNA-binding beta-propeller fold protein YncE|nr:beta-propeller fold lactonase family protein [Rhodopila sp.]